MHEMKTVGLEHYGSFLPFLPLLSLLLLLLLRHHTHRRRLPPSPPGLPIIGHLHLLSTLPHQSLHRLSSRLGPLFSLRLGSVPCVVACSASAARDFLATHDASFSNRPHTKAVSILTYGSSNFSFAPYGDLWRFTKRLYQSELFGGSTLRRFHPIRRDELRRLLGRILLNAREAAAVDVGAEVNKMTNNLITRMAVGRRCTEADDAVGLVMETTELLGRFNLGDYLWFCKDLDLHGYDKRLRDLHKRFDGLVEGIMMEKEEKRKEEEEVKEKDLLDMLMDIYEDEGAELKLTRENVKAFIRDIFTGGTDNTSLTVQWALAELLNHPAAMAKAVAELDRVVGSDRLVEESDVPELPYLRAVFCEALRLHPPTPLIPRESSAECAVGGFRIPAGTRLFVNAWAIGRDPEEWARPLEFEPERFMGEAKVKGIGWVPFGGGRRGCPGTTAALQVVHAVLAGMLQCFDWRSEGGEEVDMGESPGLTLRRAAPLVCRVTERVGFL
ncbi:hypothetical protein HPP92_027548 [Vanilla planifolia]|uniref:Uncharacterized protein n=1 Tax=Vanilla planifolia TaxID=51239 RepID=A0A835P8N2_VANPL|nr:hypothetical protein HPP92_027548 [Vanilla planifolia]